MVEPSSEHTQTGQLAPDPSVVQPEYEITVYVIPGGGSLIVIPPAPKPLPEPTQKDK